MKLELDRQEYLTMLTVVQIADWILHASGGDAPDEPEDFRALEQKILAQAKEAGCESLVERDEAIGRWVFSREFENTSLGAAYVQQYEDDVFWDWLVQRLTERDLVRKLGEEAYMKLGPVELAKREGPYFDMYDHEIQENGLERLEIVERQRVN